MSNIDRMIGFLRKEPWYRGSRRVIVVASGSGHRLIAVLREDGKKVDFIPRRLSRFYRDGGGEINLRKFGGTLAPYDAIIAADCCKSFSPDGSKVLANYPKFNSVVVSTLKACGGLAGNTRIIVLADESMCFITKALRSERGRMGKVDAIITEMGCRGV